MNKTIIDLKAAMGTFQLDTELTISLLSYSGPSVAYKRYVKLRSYLTAMSMTTFISAWHKYRHVPKEYAALQQWKKRYTQAQSTNQCSEITLQQPLQECQLMSKKPKQGFIVVHTNAVACGSSSCFIQSQDRPTVVHLDREAAIKEATRLAKNNEGHTYMVFGTIAAIIVESPVTTYEY